MQSTGTRQCHLTEFFLLPLCRSGRHAWRAKEHSTKCSTLWRNLHFQMDSNTTKRHPLRKVPLVTPFCHLPTSRLVPSHASACPCIGHNPVTTKNRTPEPQTHPQNDFGLGFTVSSAFGRILCTELGKFSRAHKLHNPDFLENV